MFGGRRRGNKRGGFRRRNCAAGKTTSCRKENRAARVAFSLPQDLSAELMFETCVNRRSELSAFRSAGFHVERRVARPARRARMRRKRLNRRSNLLARTVIARAAPHKCFHQNGFPHQTARCEGAKRRRLPPVCRNVPSSRRKTPLARASLARLLGMRLKSFNQEQFSSRSDRGVLILPQAMLLHFT
jgi:hypothetical protein